MFLVKMSLRNIWRNPGRTLITSVAVIAGVMMMVLGWGFIDGMDENFLRASSQVVSGDVLLRPPDYPTDSTSYPLDKAQVPPDLKGVLGEDTPVAARAQFFGRLINGPDATRVLVTAYDPENDPKVFPRENWKTDGEWPKPGASEVALGDRLARLMGVKKGGSVVVEARTLAGAVNAWTYTVTALVHTDNAMADGSMVWLAMPDAETLVILEGKRTHVAVKTRDPEGLKSKLSAVSGGWDIKTVREECAAMLEINDFRRRALTFMVFVIMAIAATGILNSVLMAAFERTKEIGALRALGMTRGGVATMFMIEGVTLGLVAGLIGALLGVMLVLRWETDGLILSDDMMAAQGDLSVSALIFTKFSWIAPIQSILFALFVSLIAVIYPIRFATQLNPADAVRSE